MSESQIFQRRASRLASGAYREKIARLEAELAAAHAEIEALKHDIACTLDCATAEAASADERVQTARREALEEAEQVLAAQRLRRLGVAEERDTYVEAIATIRALIEEKPQP